MKIMKEKLKNQLKQKDAEMLKMKSDLANKVVGSLF